MTRAQRRALESLAVEYGLPTGLGRRELVKQFGRSAPLCLEIGSGDGESVIAMATRHQDQDYIAVEVYRPGLGHLLHRIATLGLCNIRVVDRDVNDVLNQLSDACLSAAYLFFPDPWPKKRHHKRRLINHELLARLRPKLARHGRLCIATDCADYARHVFETLEREAEWINLAGAGHAAPRLKERPLTRFERRGIEQGHTIVDIILAPA